MSKLMIILVLFCAACSAKEVLVLRVHCDQEFEGVHDFSLALDEEENIFSLIRRSPRSQSVFNNVELQKEVVISTQHEKKVILLSCPNYNPISGGPFHIKYLYNGFTNSYKLLPLVLEKEENEWQLYTPPPNKTKINSLKVISRKLAGITIGVQNIQIVR